MLTIKTIASSSRGNMYILDNGKSRLVIECGIPWRQALQAIGFDLSGISGLLCTHEHADHSKGVKDAAKAGIDCYMSAGTANALGLYGHRIHHVVSGQQFWVHEWAVKGFDVEHDAAEPLGFFIVMGRDRVLFLTDTAYCKYRFNGITHLMIEANFCDDILERNMSAGLVERSRYQRLKKSHMSIQRVKDFLKEQDTRCLQEVHLMHLSDKNSDEQLFKAAIQKLTGCPVCICKR